MQTEIRTAKPADLGRLMQIEQSSFPKQEQCSPAMMASRLKAFPAWCFAAWRGGQLAGFVHGMGIAQPAMRDGFYYFPAMHQENAPWQCVLGLAVDPQYRGQGVGSRLMGFYAGMAQAKGRQGLVLACKEERRSFYQKIGFCCAGASQSHYGKSAWLDMAWRF